MVKAILYEVCVHEGILGHVTSSVYEMKELHFKDENISFNTQGYCFKTPDGRYDPINEITKQVDSRITSPRILKEMDIDTKDYEKILHIVDQTKVKEDLIKKLFK